MYSRYNEIKNSPPARNILRPALAFTSKYQDKIIFPRNEYQVIKEINLGM